MGGNIDTLLWRYSRHNPRYRAVAASLRQGRLPLAPGLSNLRNGLRDFRSWPPAKFMISVTKWAVGNVAWMLLFDLSYKISSMVVL